MNDKTAATTAAAFDDQLDQVALSDGRRAMLDVVRAKATGSPAYVARKAEEFRRLAAFSQTSGRFDVIGVDPGGDLRVIIAMDVPVPVRPDPTGEVLAPRGAILGVCWPEQVLTQKLPGAAFVTVINPSHDIFHPQVHPITNTLCLGSQTPMIAVPLVEILLLGYAALSMQVIQVDEFDAAGVFNPEAARYFQEHLDRTPLLREPFIKQTAVEASEVASAS